MSVIGFSQMFILLGAVKWVSNALVSQPSSQVCPTLWYSHVVAAFMLFYTLDINV